MAVQRQHVLVQQQLHLAHRVVDEGGLQLAFPDNDDLPSVLLQHSVVLLVALLVPPNFGDPELPVRRRNLAATRADNFQFSIFNFQFGFVSMPEAPVDEYRRPVGPHHDIRLPRNTLHVQPIPIPMRPQPPPHLQLRLRVLAADVRHASVPLLRSHRVGHIDNNRREYTFYNSLYSLCLNFSPFIRDSITSFIS